MLLALYVRFYISSIAQATTWIVPDNKETIQLGIDAANTGDTVLVRCGTYDENIKIDSKNICLRSETGEYDCVTIEALNDTSVVYLRLLDTSAIIEGFTITGGDSDKGGGICCKNANPLIKNCLITENNATIEGGGIYCSLSSPNIVDCVISNNTVTYGDGGGVYCLYNSPTFTNCSITGNTAFPHPTGYRELIVQGGGIKCKQTSSLDINGCSISENIVYGSGGGICCYWDSLTTITNCIITDNSTIAPPDDELVASGGGMSLWESYYLELIGSTISGNSSEYFGGGITCGESSESVTIESCVLTGNSAYKWGGAMHIDNSDPIMIISCTISGNRAVDTLSFGGGINCQQSNLRLENTILWDDYASRGLEIYSYVCNDTFKCCDVNPAWIYKAGGSTKWEDGNINRDPKFCDPRRWTDAPTTEGEYTIFETSPCAPSNSPSGCNLIGALGVGCNKDGDPAFYECFVAESETVTAGETRCWYLKPGNFGFVSPKCPNTDTFCVWAYGTEGLLINGNPHLGACIPLDPVPDLFWWQEICVTVPCEAEICDHETLIVNMTYCDAILMCRSDWTDCEDPNIHESSPYYSADTLILHVVESPPETITGSDSVYFIEQGQVTAYVPFTICNGDACADPTVYDYEIGCTPLVGDICLGDFPQTGATPPIDGGECDDVYGIVNASTASIGDKAELEIIVWDDLTGTVYDTCVQIVHVVEPVPVPLFTAPVVTVLVLAMILSAVVIMKKRITRMV